MKPFQNKDIEKKFALYPEPFRTKLLYLRQLIFDVAEKTEGVGKIEEVLKWGEPSYLTTETSSGSTIRMDWKKSTPHQYALYFNCKTSLLESFRNLYGDLFIYGGSRSIIFNESDEIPEKELSNCIKMALVYHIMKNK